jgi:hypothetical protein
VALAADGDISQYHYIRTRVSLKTIAVFLKYRVKREAAKAEGFDG